MRAGAPANPVRHEPAIDGPKPANRRGAGGAGQAAPDETGFWRQLRIRVQDAFGPISTWVKEPYQPTPMKPRCCESSAAWA